MSAKLYCSLVRSVWLLACASLPAAVQASCGPLQNAYGPFDYWSEYSKIIIVEQHHFDAGVESLLRGRSGSLGGDLDYTLRASPNHPRALMTMLRYGQRIQRPRVPGASYTVQCYIERAEEFKPKDMMVKVIAATYYLRSGRKAEALEKLKEVSTEEESNPNFFYNLGLVQAELGQWDAALSNAQRAYASGFPLPGLREQLKRAGKWKELPAAPASPQSPPASAASAPEPEAGQSAPEAAASAPPAAASAAQSAP